MIKNSDSPEEIDWFGRWYEILKERGENDEPTLGLYSLKSGTIEWFRFSHSQMDGVGALNTFYNKKNFLLQRFPDLKEKKAPHFFQYIYYLLLLIFKKKLNKPIWKEQNAGLKPLNLHQLSYEIFSKDETEKILNYAKKEKVSPCAFLMKVVSESLMTELSYNGEGAWTLPVNLRPVLKRKNFNSNHSSGILINYSKNSTAQSLHQNIKTSLKNKEHWCIWIIHQVGKLIGIKGMRFLSRRSSQKTFMIGSFSYLGSWDLPVDDIWIGGPPGSKNFPISIMVMIANNQMSLSMKIHPFILKNQDHTDLYLRKTTANLREILAQG